MHFLAIQDIGSNRIAKKNKMAANIYRILVTFDLTMSGVKLSRFMKIYGMVCFKMYVLLLIYPQIVMLDHQKSIWLPFSDHFILVIITS